MLFFLILCYYNFRYKFLKNLNINKNSKLKPLIPKNMLYFIIITKI